MDETEVQCEIACWIEAHPEAAIVNCTNHREPWVQFVGRLGTLKIGLGGLIWSIKVPAGYQTTVDPRDGQRKRLWEPLEFGDSVVVQSRNTPFVVSVCNYSLWNVLSGLEQLFADKMSLSEDESEEGSDGQTMGTVGQTIAPISAVQGRKNHPEKDFCLAALKTAETLGEVLDAIHSLAKLYDGNPDPDSDTGDDFEEEYHLFGAALTMNWGGIAAQVAHARTVCRNMAFSETTGKSPYEELYGLCSSPPASGSATPPKSELEFQSSISKMQELCLASPLSACDSEEEFTIVYPPSSSWAFNISVEASELQPDRAGSDSDDSDGSWDMVSDCEPNITTKNDLRDLGNSPVSRRKRKLQRVDSGKLFSQPEAPGQLSLSEGTEPNAKRATIEETRRVGANPGLRTRNRIQESAWEDFTGLQWCDLALNASNFSVECTIQLNKVMVNAAVATALGFSLEHPLRVEIVPNKALVDAQSWEGNVEVNVSQESGWHNHDSEEICGLLCLVPCIAETYFSEHVPLLIRELGPKKDLFVGFLGTLLTRLASLSVGGCCSVCGRFSQRPKLSSLAGRTLWHCEDPGCQTKFADWKKVSSVDAAWEREMEEKSKLLVIEQSLRDEFRYQGNPTPLRMLRLYGVDPTEMCYGEVISALAKIELWNQKDENTQALFV